MVYLILFVLCVAWLFVNIKQFSWYQSWLLFPDNSVCITVTVEPNWFSLSLGISHYPQITDIIIGFFFFTVSVAFYHK